MNFDCIFLDEGCITEKNDHFEHRAAEEKVFIAPRFNLTENDFSWKLRLKSSYIYDLKKIFYLLRVKSSDSWDE